MNLQAAYLNRARAALDMAAGDAGPARGLNFARGLIALHAVKRADPDLLRAFAVRNWGEQYAEQIVKAAVGAETLSDFGGVDAASEFFGLVHEQSVLGRLEGLRRVQINVRTLSMVSGTTAYWVGQGKPKPLSKPALQGDTLAPLKVACITVTTEESLRANPTAETLFRDDMLRAITGALDQALLDPSNAGVADESPASVLYGVTPTASTGNPAADIAALIAAFTGDLGAAYFVTDPGTATQIAMARDAGGSFAFPNAGPRGGNILGIPLLVSRASPITSAGAQLALIDPTGIAANAEGIRMEASSEATLQMADDPSDAVGTGVSMFQTGSVAWLSEIAANWDVQRAGSAAYIDGVSYAAGS